MTLYEADLARIQAEAFGGQAADAAPAIVRRLLGASPRPRRILDVGCGAGITSRAFTDAGFEVVGIDPSEALLGFARAAAPAARFVRGSAYDVPLPDADAIVAVGEPLTYHAPEVDADARLGGFFREAANVLSRGGSLIFDLIVSARAGEGALDATRHRSSASWALLVETVESPETRSLARHIVTFIREPDTDLYRRGRETHHVRLFDEDRVVAMLRAAGFHVETTRAWDDRPMLPRRVGFFAQKASA